MTSKKMKAKGRAILKAKSTIHPPNFNIMDYKLSMIRALNYYSAEVDDKDKRKFAVVYWKNQGKDTSKLSNVADAWFSTIGAVAHMATAGIPLEEHDLIRLDNAYYQLIDMFKQDVVDNVAPVQHSSQHKKSIQDYMDENASLHIGEIEGALDDLMINGTEFDTKAYLTGHQVKSPVAKRIGEWFKKKLSEYSSIDDKETLDAYGGKRVINKVVNQLQSIVNDCGTIAVIAKTTRAPRKRKEKPPSVLVSKMKWLREFVDLGLKSVHPEKIVGADTVVFYDTIKRRIFKYEASDGYTLSVKGTTLLNWNPEKSGSKIIRKPEEQLKGVSSLTKRPMNNMINEIKATLGKVNGRTNENMIIIGVY